MNANLTTNGHRMKLLTSLSVTSNVSATTTTPVLNLGGMNYLAAEAVLTVASGGGTLDVYVQTSLDNGSTWIDIMNFHFTTATASKVSAVNTYTALAAAVTPGDAALTSNTILSGLLGDRIRLKYTSGGTAYGAGTTLSVSAVAKL